MRKVTLPPHAWRAYKWPAGNWYFLPAMFPNGDRDDSGAFRVWGCQRACLMGRFAWQDKAETIADTLTANDILTVRLYYSVAHEGHMVATGAERLPDYDDTIALIRAVGPRLRGVMVGNDDYTELSYRHIYGAWRGNAIGNVRAVAEFILNVGALLRDLGVTPWFATMDWDILQDAYKGQRRILDALDCVGGANYVACGYASVPGAYIKPNFPYVHDHLRWQSALTGKGWSLPEDGEEFPVLRDYLQDGNHWCGLCGPTGIRAGNLAILSAYGYKGFITGIPPAEVPKLAAELGDGWWNESSLARRGRRAVRNEPDGTPPQQRYREAWGAERERA